MPLLVAYRSLGAKYSMKINLIMLKLLDVKVIRDHCFWFVFYLILNLLI